MNKKGNLLAIILAVWLVGCQNEKSDPHSNIVSIDLDKMKEESINDWFENIELVPLSSTDATFMKEASKVIVSNSNFYVIDNWQHLVFVFDSLGNYVNSTKRLKGNGPNEYVSLIDFDIDRTNGNLHLLDAVSSKIKIYDKEMSFINSYTIDKAVLPLYYFKYLKDNLYAFYSPKSNKGEYALIFYEASGGKVLREEIPTIVKEANYLPCTVYSPFYEFNEHLLFTQKYPNNEIFKIDVNTLEVEKYLQYDFKEHTFHLEDIQSLDSKNLDDYTNYMEAYNKDKAFIFNKCENDRYYILSVYYKQRIYIIRHNKSTKQNRVVVNDYTKEGSLGRPFWLDNDYYYCISAPETVHVLVNDVLLTERSRLILSKLKEDDNPVIIKYKFKKESLLTDSF